MKTPRHVLFLALVLAAFGLGCDPGACEVDGECANGDVCMDAQCIEPCDALGECGNAGSGCIACAQETVCQAEMQRCDANLDCQQLLQAIKACAKEGPDKIDDACYNATIELHQEGYAIYYDIATCVWCGPCTTSCAEYAEEFCR